jgi:hypothetical protein
MNDTRGIEQEQTEVTESMRLGLFPDFLSQEALRKQRKALERCKLLRGRILQIQPKETCFIFGR